MKTNQRERERDTRKALFYAESDADMFDAAPDLNTPLYSLLQETITKLLSDHIDRYISKNVVFNFLDLGSGTGAECLPILEKYPNSRVVALDVCQPMHDQLRKNAETVLGTTDIDSRIKFLTCDMADEEASAEAVIANLETWTGEKSFDFIISSMAIHHLTTIEKRVVYDRVGKMLVPGGLFVNVDLFSYDTPELAELAQKFGVEWIKKQFSTPDRDLQTQLAKLGDRAQSIGQRWVDHYLNYNSPSPIHSNSSTHSAVDHQAAMLIEAGFTQIEVPFRFWEVGILWAIR
jgi:SAM-dependent methyltransferase